MYSTPGAGHLIESRTSTGKKRHQRPSLYRVAANKTFMVLKLENVYKLSQKKYKYCFEKFNQEG
jgi:hypothetical protein